MAGSVAGGKQAAATNKSKYGSDFYHKIGSKGGSAKVPKGFALMDKEKVRDAGAKGGSVSRRHAALIVEEGVKKSWLRQLFGR